MVPNERRASAYRLFTAGYGLAWFLGSALIGVLYDISIRMTVVACILLVIAATPFFVKAQRAVSEFPPIQKAVNAETQVLSRNNRTALSPSGLDSIDQDDYFSFNATGEDYFARRCGCAACSVHFRLRANVNAGTGDAVLQFDALLITRSSWSGLLQDHAINARPVCAAPDYPRRFFARRAGRAPGS